MAALPTAAATALWRVISDKLHVSLWTRFSPFVIDMFMPPSRATVRLHADWSNVRAECAPDAHPVSRSLSVARGVLILLGMIVVDGGQNSYE